MRFIKNIEELILTYRAKHGITITEFANRAKLSKPTLYEALRGNASPLTLKKIELAVTEENIEYRGGKPN